VTDLDAATAVKKVIVKVRDVIIAGGSEIRIQVSKDKHPAQKVLEKKASLRKALAE
jgi:hypothetical protein